LIWVSSTASRRRSASRRASSRPRVYIALGLAFRRLGLVAARRDAGMNYVTGFVIEKSLAMDNVFVIAMIFTYFAVPRLYQHRVLFWGILGVIVLRAIMIGLGAALVEQFGWVLYVFAAFLIFTGIKMWMMADKPYDVGAIRSCSAQDPLSG
jgi:tellurite resistance protein TerC